MTYVPLTDVRYNLADLASLAVRGRVARTFPSQPACPRQNHWVSRMLALSLDGGLTIHHFSVDVKKNQVEMSFKKKPGKVAAKQKPTSGLADFAVGQKVDTLVRKVCSSMVVTGYKR